MSDFDPLRTLTLAARLPEMPTIYMPLLNEGTEVWRPVEASHLKGDTYRVEGPVPEDEEWAFAPGTLVCCEPKTFSDGENGLTAVSAAS